MLLPMWDSAHLLDQVEVGIIELETILREDFTVGLLLVVLPGVPQYCFHFVFVIFSGSGARTEKLLTFIQQPWKFAT